MRKTILNSDTECFPFQDGHTALHIAVTHGQALVVETLLGFGAAVQLKAGAVRKILSSKV